MENVKDNFTDDAKSRAELAGRAAEALYSLQWDNFAEGHAYWSHIFKRLHSIAADARKPALTEYVVVSSVVVNLVTPMVIRADVFDKTCKENQSMYTVHHRFKA